MNFVELIAVAEKDPQSVDFADLRYAYTQSEAYQPTNHFSYGRLQGATNQYQSFEEIEIVCKKILRDNPMDLEVRMLLEFAYDQMEQHDLAAHHHAFTMGMFNAIQATGDGKSLETAWEVVSVAEEYTMLSVMGLQMQQQALINRVDRHFDILTCVPRKNPGASPIELYFDITAPYTYLQRTLLE